MSVINRIEIASLLNKHGDISSPWEAKMRHLVLNLRGQSTAMNMENGFGKTSLSDALIGMLSRDRTLMKKTRRKMSPSRDGHPWTHIRVEFSYTSGPVVQSDILALAGDSVGGSEQWVFGLYGHSDTDAGYYFYQGRLEELPVHSITADSKLQLFSNEHFQHCLRQLKPERPKERELWLDAISAHISRKELEQLASFQKDGGADKSQIFNAIKPRPGEKADQAFFYEVLAPQILAGASQGETDESEEFIEDLIINSGRKVSELRHQILENSQDLERNERKEARLEELSQAADQLTHTRQQLEETLGQLGDQASCMSALMAQGIPGTPAVPSDTDPEYQLAQEFAIRVGELEPYVPLSALANLSSGSARKIESWFESHQLSGIRHDRQATVYHPQASWASAKSMRLYPVAKVVELLVSSQDLFKDDVHRVKSIEQIKEAADHFLDLDTNPFRENYLADQTFLISLREELSALKEKQRQWEQQREALQTRDKEFTDNETVYTDALKEGWFSEQELENPDRTESEVKELLKALSKQYDEFLQTEGRFSIQKKPWDRFQKDHGSDITPADILQEKEQQYEELKGQQGQQQDELDRCKSREKELGAQQQTLAQKLPGLQNRCDQLEGLSQSYTFVRHQFPDEDVIGLTHRLEQQQRQSRDKNNELLEQRRQQQGQLQALQVLEPAYNNFCQVFPEQSPEGLEDRLRQQEAKLEPQVRQQEEKVTYLQGLLSDLLQFREQFSETDPALWLAQAKEAYPLRLTERSQVETAIQDIERQLSDLETDPVSPGAAEVQCHELLKKYELSPQPLHQVITRLLPEEDDRKRQWLTQAHNLLFAPVLSSEQQARTAAEQFARHRLPVPIFTEDSLQQAIEQGDNRLLGAAIGYESLGVKSLLDPSFIAQWRQELSSELGELQQRLSELEQDIAHYSPDSISMKLAIRAAEAIKEAVETLLPKQQTLLTDNQQQLNTLKEQLSPENCQLIRKAEGFMELGGASAMTKLNAALTDTQEAIEELASQLNRLDELLSGEQRHKLDQAERFVQQGGESALAQLQEEFELLSLQQQQASEQYEQCREALEQVEQHIRQLRIQMEQLYQPGEKDQLMALHNYLLDGGPEFMAQAKDRRASLESQKNRAQQRASLKFDRIRAYLLARDDEEGALALKKQIAALKQQLDSARKQEEEKQAQVDRIQAELPLQLQAIRQVDETTHRWLTQLAQFSPDMLKQWSESDPEKLEAMPLFIKAEQYQSACNTNDRDQVLHWAEALAEQLDMENTQALHRDLKECNKKHEEQQERFRDVLTRIQETELNLFNATEQVRLNGLEQANSEALKELRSMIATIGEQLTKSKERQELLEASMEGNEQNLQERLSSIIMYSADNLRTLKRVAKDSAGKNAYFVIDADIVSDEGIRQLVRALLAEIEEHQKQIRRRKAQSLPVGSEEKQKRDLQKNLRSQIYRQLFTNIRIRLKHDAIRPHGNLFSLNEDMSEGQREALSLMWLVKLSEFAIERELRSVPSQYRRRERKSGESVIILDGLFSKLSHRKLIEDSLESLRNTRGRFQMIGLIHNPNYENDPGIFPTYLVGNVIGGLQGQGGHVIVKEGVKVSPEAVGRGVGEASLFHLHVDHDIA